MPSLLRMQLRWEVIQHLASRYQHAPRTQKTHLLNECVSVTGYTRKYALRLLDRPKMPGVTAPYMERKSCTRSWLPGPLRITLCQTADPFLTHVSGGPRTAWASASEPGTS